MKALKLLVMIPAYNEENSIVEVVKAIPKIKGIKTDILVIDDGSRDRTAMRAASAGAKVISFAANRGLVNAFERGINYAVSNNYDYIVNLDADGQHDPADIPRLVRPLLNNRADMVIGSRFKKRKPKKGFIKFFGNIFFSELISVLTQTRITDAQSGYRAFSYEVAEKIKLNKGYTYTQQMIIQANYHRFKIVEIPIIERRRLAGKSRLIKNPFDFLFKAGYLLLTVLISYNPLLVFSSIGFASMVAGTLIGLLTERRLLSAVIILTGLQIILFGIFVNKRDC